ncbi:MAG: cell envelope integrity protein TolA [Patescibacteria group bacterium]|jgi:hypothetical protein
MSDQISTTTNPVGSCVHCSKPATGGNWEKYFRVPSMIEIENFLEAQGMPRIVQEEHLFMVLVCSVCRPELEAAGMAFHQVCSARRLIKEDEVRRAEQVKREAEAKVKREAREAEAKVKREAREAEAKVKRERAAATAALFGHKPDEQRQRPHRTEVIGRIEPTTRPVELPRHVRGNGQFRNSPFADMGQPPRNEERTHPKSGKRNRGHRS